MKIMVLLISAYCLGSINFSILFTRIFKKDDPRTRYSGNPGVTNIYRQAGLPAATAVFLLDLGRSVSLCLMALYLVPGPWVPWIGLALITGTRYPVFHQFKGGKGVANYFGFTLMISPAGAGLSALGWLCLFRISRIPFIASFLMVSILAAATLMTLGLSFMTVLGTVLSALFILFNHRENIRLLVERKM